MAATEAPEAEKAAPRPVTTFRVLVRPVGGVEWTLIDATVDGRTQDEGKKAASRLLAEDGTYGPLIQGEGIEIAVTSARSFKPVTVKVEPQPAKVVIR